MFILSNNNFVVYYKINLSNVYLQDYGILKKGDIDAGYYGRVNIVTIAEWWKEYETKLFSKNIRYYKGDTEVNNGIKETLKNEPENFLFYNNGIKIVADKVSKAAIGSGSNRTIGLFNLENASIVNGAQTTGAIGEYMETLDTEINAEVFIQIISLEKFSAEKDDEITKYSNTQNRIENKDFVSLDPFHKRLQQDFVMDGITYYYKSGYTVPNVENSCCVDDVAISVGCGLEDIAIVTTIKNNIGKIYEKIDKEPYTSIFNSRYNTIYIWNCIQINREFEKVNNRVQNDISNNLKLISVHGNRFLLHIFLRYFNSQYKLYSSYLNDEQKNNIRDIMLELLPKVIEELSEIKNNKFPDAYPANVFKSMSRCKELINGFNNSDLYKEMYKFE